ncbi:MAG: DUF1640 domain-containing protein [candidate division WOR-3 bacterium]
MKIITIPKVLREKLGEDGVDALIELLNASNEKLKIDLIELQTEKYERRLAEETAKIDKRITEEIHKLRSEDIARLDKRITEESAKLDKRITEEINKLRSEDIARLDKRITEETARLDKRITEETGKLRVEISRSYANIIKWMFIFWVGQISVMTLIFFTFLKFIK